MKKIIHIILLSIACVSASYSVLWATKATAKIVKYKQSDGSIISLKMFGDEFFGYASTLDGRIVSAGKDKCLYYANYDKGYLQLTDTRVGASATAVRSGAGKASGATAVPYNIQLSLRNMAADKILPLSAMRQNISEEEGIGGERRSLVLLVQFADIEFTVENAVDYFTSLLNGGAADYFNANFRGRYSFSFNVSDIVTLSGTAGHYGDRTPYLNDANVSGMVVEACRNASENGVDFSKYDIDNDGVVDNVAIIFAGLNEAESGEPSVIWPHKGDISDKNIFCNGVKIASYTCSSEYSGGNAEYYPASIGSFCHEFAHTLGLVDMYDVNGEEEGLSESLFGLLSIMDEGNYLNNGKTPPYFNAIERQMLGIANVTDLVAEREYELSPIYSADTLYRIPTNNEGEYFLLECRDGSGWDKYIGGSGLVIYHVDKSETICGGLSAASRWRLNIVNSYAEHGCARVLASDPVKVSSDMPGYIFYPGISEVHSVTATGVPSLTDWNHSGLGISIDGIVYENSSVRFSVKEDLVYCDTIPSAKECRVQTYQKNAFVTWKISDEGYSGGGSWALIIDDGSGKNRKVSLAADTLSYMIWNLEPGKSYNVKLYFSKDSYMGEVVSLDFAADEITSPYPFIKLSGRYSVGDILNICVQNLVEEYNSLELFVNGDKLSGVSYKFEEAGEYDIEAVIKYPDKTSDVISKRIIVN